MPFTPAQIQQLAYDCGFEIAGVAAASPHRDYARFETWAASGKAGALRYLTDHRGALRADPRNLLSGAQSIICLAKLYNTDRPFSTDAPNSSEGWISRYAWGLDYHDILRAPLEALIRKLKEIEGNKSSFKICIDTAPLLERSYAHAAGLGWIGKNTCLINEHYGSWFFLAELLTDLDIEPGIPVSDRCGTCTRCISACPTQAIVPNSDGGFAIDARLCISYLTIEERGPIASTLAVRQGRHIFGCDICQDVCPWNLRAHLKQTDITDEPGFSARIFAPSLAELADLDEDEFRLLFRDTPVWRSKYEGFLRNVAIAMGNSSQPSLLEPLSRLTKHRNQLVASTAIQALNQLKILTEST